MALRPAYGAVDRRAGDTDLFPAGGAYVSRCRTALYDHRHPLPPPCERERWLRREAAAAEASVGEICHAAPAPATPKAQIAHVDARKALAAPS